MSVVAIRAALETRLAAMGSMLTAWENAPFSPPDEETPYQVARTVFATPDNPEMGTGFRELGFFQVTLQYPQGAGSKDAATKALAVRAQFPKNMSLTNAGVVVTINKTPEIGNGVIDGDRWAVPIKIPFHANLF